MTNWTEQLKNLDNLGSTNAVELLIDGKHKLLYSAALFNRKIIIAWLYYNDYKVEFMKKDNEIGKLFGQPRFHLVSPKLYKAIKTVHGKKEADKIKKQRKENPIMFRSYWTSSRMLISHLKRNFKTIELIQEQSDELVF